MNVLLSNMSNAIETLQRNQRTQASGMAATNSNVAEQQNNVTDIFPNPSKSIVYINFDKILNNNTIEVYNSLGKLCIKEELDQQNNYELNMEKLCSGVNYIIIKNDKGHVESHKVIKIDP